MGDSTLGDSTLGDLHLKTFLDSYINESIDTYYSDRTNKYPSDTLDIHNNLNDYVNKIITRDEFLEKDNVFINEFDKFSDAQKKEKKRCYRS